MPDDNVIPFTGAAGYVDGPLLPLLFVDGCRECCLARQPGPWMQGMPAGGDVMSGHVPDAASLAAALQDGEAAYYLVHSMGATGDFETKDRIAGDNFAAAAPDARVQRIIYLAGLGGDEPDLSTPVRRQHNVGERLRAHEVLSTEFRACLIIGSGTVSCEMIWGLAERLPVMIAPRRSRRRRLKHLRSSMASAARRDGISRTGFGRCAPGWTCSRARCKCSVAVVMHSGCEWGTRWIAGSSNPSTGRAVAAVGGDETAGLGMAEIQGAAGWSRGAPAPDGDVRSSRLFGLAYWYGEWRLQQLVFAGRWRALTQAAEEQNAK